MGASLKHFVRYSETGTGSLVGLEVPIVVVVCTRCATQFQFDESRLPLAGAKVRCSRCREAFFLAHPEAETSAGILSVEAGRAMDSDATESLEEHATTLPEVESEQSPSGEDFDWDFDFSAQSDGRSSPGLSSSRASSGSSEPAPTQSRSQKKQDDPTVFASVEDLADWLADRTDTLEPDLTARENVPTQPTSASEPARPVQLALGVMKKKPAPDESSQVMSPEGSGPSAVRRPWEGAGPVVDSGEGLLADLLGTSRTQVPRWFRVGLNRAVQVVGWSLTLALVTLGLVHGLWPDF